LEFQDVLKKATLANQKKQLEENPYASFENAIFLVDFNYVAIRNLFALYRGKEDNSTNPKVYYNILLQIFKNASKGSPIRIILCHDHYLNWRKTVDPDYKNRRKGFKEQFNIDWKNFHRNLGQLVESCVKLFGIDHFCVKGCEADDLIAILSRRLPGKKVILSADKDLTQLIDKKTIQINPFDIKLKIMEDGIQSKEEFVKAYAIAGQGKDDIPQIRKFLGIKTAIKILRGEKKVEFTPEEKKRIKLNEILMDLNQIPRPVEDFVMKEMKKMDIGSFGDRNEILDFVEESQFGRRFFDHLDFLNKFKKNRKEVF